MEEDTGAVTVDTPHAVAPRPPIVAGHHHHIGGVTHAHAAEATLPVSDIIFSSMYVIGLMH